MNSIDVQVSVVDITRTSMQYLAQVVGYTSAYHHDRPYWWRMLWIIVKITDCTWWLYIFQVRDNLATIWPYLIYGLPTTQQIIKQKQNVDWKRISKCNTTFIKLYKTYLSWILLWNKENIWERNLKVTTQHTHQTRRTNTLFYSIDLEKCRFLYGRISRETMAWLVVCDQKLKKFFIIYNTSLN